MIPRCEDGRGRVDRKLPPSSDHVTFSHGGELALSTLQAPLLTLAIGPARIQDVISLQCVIFTRLRQKGQKASSHKLHFL